MVDTFELEANAISKLSNCLSNHVLPLFQHEKGKPKLVGTGFLVSTDLDDYLISAAHVFDELAKGNELFFYININTTAKLSGKLLRTKLPPNKNRTEDKLDIGVLKLDKLIRPPYREIQKYSLSINALIPNALPRDEKQYLIIGFPETKSRINPMARELKSKLSIFRNISAPTIKYDELGLETSNHIVINFEIKRTISPNKTIRTFPKPSGMSGAPVWLLYDNNNHNDPNQTPIVGVLIEHHPSKKALVATDINIALKLIHGMTK